MIKSILVLLVLPMAAQADIQIAQAFAGVTPERHACYTRQYTPEHMRANKRQTVERIKIKLRQVKLDDSTETTPTLAIQVKRKGEKNVWTNNIACWDNEKNKSVYCNVDCDGGSVEVLAIDRSGTMTLKNNGVLLHGGCGDEGKTIFLKSRRGGDDVFKLSEAAPSDCSDVSDEAY